MATGRKRSGVGRLGQADFLLEEGESRGSTALQGEKGGEELWRTLGLFFGLPEKSLAKWSSALLAALKNTVSAPITS